ncbi:autophagy-like protein [Rhizoctonia solani 123E]|uniref:Autophagy-like protein n=1 Tax=Rhizoctonia solani 123E TaxID=1423351 RepID=A0A074S5T8_9AGAM|nr:autophagy-like protein [Rhizoctonia solani 123E]
MAATTLHRPDLLRDVVSMSWQEELRQRLVERNAEETVYAGIIEQYRRLAQQARLLNERNASLLRAVGSVQSQPGSASQAASGPDNPVRVAYVASLESQITALRDELAAVYKTQGQNAQRLLSMNETLREKEEQTRLNLEELRHAKDELERLRKVTKDHKEQIDEKNRALQVLIDEAQTHQLELSQIEQRNEVLKKDNAGLLQRWLDHMNDSANKMNHANAFVSASHDIIDCTSYPIVYRTANSRVGISTRLDRHIRTRRRYCRRDRRTLVRVGKSRTQRRAIQLAQHAATQPQRLSSMVCGCSSPIDAGTAIGLDGRAAVAWYEARRAVAERDALIRNKLDEDWSVVDAPDVEPDTTSNNPSTDDWEQCSPVAD